MLHSDALPCFIRALEELEQFDQAQGVWPVIVEPAHQLDRLRGKQDAGAQVDDARAAFTEHILL